jgi:hypothetical protein
LKKIGDQRGQEEEVGLGVGGGRRKIIGEEGGDRGEDHYLPSVGYLPAASYRVQFFLQGPT